MSSIFLNSECATKSDRKRFGLYDDPSPAQNKAYLKENEGETWIAVVHNDLRTEITFTAVDNCIDIYREDGKMEKRCDGFLSFETTIIFVELKQREDINNKWVIEAEEQLKATISNFEKEEEAARFDDKKAYISNSMRPKFKSSQSERMERFSKSTGYILRIENTIKLHQQF